MRHYGISHGMQIAQRKALLYNFHA